MDNEKLNTQLYEKMFEEQEKYRGWLLTQPPEEILNHTYEYTMREDILMSLEYNDLTSAQATALLTSPSPLADVFSTFEDRETDHMDNIRDCIESRANDVIAAQRNTPVYMQTAAYAKEHNELPEFRASNKLNEACKQALEEAIGDNYADNRLNTKAAFEQVAEQFGTERMKYVLAVTVTQKDWDGRISGDNKAWAKTVPIVDNKDAWGGDRNSAFVVDQAHTGLVDLFVTHARKEFAQEASIPEKKPSVLDKLQKAATEPKLSTASKKKDMEL